MQNEYKTVLYVVKSRRHAERLHKMLAHPGEVRSLEKEAKLETPGKIVPILDRIVRTFTRVPTEVMCAALKNNKENLIKLIRQRNVVDGPVRCYYIIVNKSSNGIKEKRRHRSITLADKELFPDYIPKSIYFLFDEMWVPSGGERTYRPVRGKNTRLIDAVIV